MSDISGAMPDLQGRDADDEDDEAYMNRLPRQRVMDEMRVVDAGNIVSRLQKMPPKVGLVADQEAKAVLNLERIIYQCSIFLRNEPHKSHSTCEPWYHNVTVRWFKHFYKWGRCIADLSLTEIAFVARCFCHAAVSLSTRATLSERDAKATHARVRMIIQEFKDFGAEYADEMESLYDRCCSMLVWEPYKEQVGAQGEIGDLFSEETKDNKPKDLRAPDLDSLTYFRELSEEPRQGNEKYNDELTLNQLVEGELHAAFTEFHPDLLTEYESMAVEAMDKLPSPRTMEKGKKQHRRMKRLAREREKEAMARRKIADRRRKADRKAALRINPELEANEDDAQLDVESSSDESKGEIETDDSSSDSDEEGDTTHAQEGDLRFNMDAENNAITIEDARDDSIVFKDHRLPQFKGKESLYAVNEYSRKAFVIDCNRLFYWNEVRRQFLLLHDKQHMDVPISDRERKLIWKGFTRMAEVEQIDIVKRDALEFFVRSELPCGAIESYLRQRPMARANASTSDVMEFEGSRAQHLYLVETYQQSKLQNIMRPDVKSPMRHSWMWILLSRIFVGFVGQPFASPKPITSASFRPEDEYSVVAERAKASRKRAAIVNHGVIDEVVEYDPTFFCFFDDIPERWEKVLMVTQYGQRRRPIIFSWEQRYCVQNVKPYPKRHAKHGEYYRELFWCQDPIHAINTWFRLIREQYDWKLANGKDVRAAYMQFTHERLDEQLAAL